MVTDYLMGNKNNFAIEFTIQSERYDHNLYGWLKIWLRGIYVGAYEDICDFSVILHALEQFLKQDTNTDAFDSLDEDTIYWITKESDELGMGKYWFCPGGDSFDDFSMVVYSSNGIYKFIWKLHEKTFFHYKDYPIGFQFAEVSIEDFKRVVKDFRKQIERLKNEIPMQS